MIFSLSYFYLIISSILFHRTRWGKCRMLYPMFFGMDKGSTPEITGALESGAQDQWMIMASPNTRFRGSGPQ